MTKIQTQALRKGTEIAVYQIKDVLGSNSSEIAYRVWNEHLNTTVILKEFFPSDYVERDEEDQFVREKSKKDSPVFEFGLNNFIQKSEKLLAVQHPSVQSAHNVLQFNHTAYFAVDDVQGTLLSEQLEKSKSFNEDELLIILTSLLNALQDIHEAGIVHGDICPDNILIKKNGEPVLMNFAAAHQGFAEHVKMLASELHEGYASPEQYEKGNQAGASTDLYSLGATLYRCITKTDPVDGQKRISDLNDNKADPLLSISERGETGFSEDFLQTIDRMLQLDVKERPQSANEVLTELNKDNKNSKAIEAATPVKIKTITSNDMDIESKEGHVGTVFALVGMVGAVAIGSVLIWFLQKGYVNQVANISEPEKLGDVAPVVAESGSKHSDEIQIIEKELEPEPEQTALAKLPEEVPVKLAEQGKEVVSKIEVPTETPPQSGQFAETNTISQNSIGAKPSEESLAALAKSEQKVEPIAVNKVLVKDDLIKQHMASAEESIAAFRLTTPSEDNAYSHYKAVLEIDPEHEGARKGVRQIVDRYILLIDKEIEKDQAGFALIYLNRAKNILPNSPYLKIKTEELNSYLGNSSLPED